VTSSGHLENLPFWITQIRVFRIPPGIQLDPAEVGFGLGLTQGLVAGLFIGLVIVVSVAWYRSRVVRGSS